MVCSMKKLKIKPDMWQVHYRTKRNPKQICYMTYGYSAMEIVTKHYENPNYKDTKIMGIVNLIDEEF